MRLNKEPSETEILKEELNAELTMQKDNDIISKIGAFLNRSDDADNAAHQPILTPP